MSATRSRIPNWIIAGAPKAGTSSLFRWLSDHPEVAAAKEKETYYFVDPGTHMYRRNANFASAGLEGYGRLFRHARADAKVVLEATPGYMYGQVALRELPDLPSRPGFIFVLREPVAQLHSLYRYFSENWNWIPRDMSFQDFIVASAAEAPVLAQNELAQYAVQNAHYELALRRWAQACARKRMHILLFEDLVHDRRRAMQAVATRLAIDPEFYTTYHFPKENATYRVRNGLLQKLNIKVRGYLPKGLLYDCLRRIYRSLNTTPEANPEFAESHAWIIALTERYEMTCAALENEFQLDLSPWRQLQATRRGRCGDGAAAARLEALEDAPHG